MRRIVLSSGSRRRADLMSLLGVDYETSTPAVDESRHPGEEPPAYVERLARAKAAAASGPEVVAVGGDTIVVHRGQVLGKPAHPAEARRMLRALSGDTHEVLSGVAVAWVEDGEMVVESLVESATVHFSDLLPGEIDAYVDSGESLDRAGAYAIQEKGGLFVEWIHGHPTTVIGLPLPTLRRLLARAGVEIL